MMTRPRSVMNQVSYNLWIKTDNMVRLKKLHWGRHIVEDRLELVVEERIWESIGRQIRDQVLESESFLNKINLRS